MNIEEGKVYILYRRGKREHIQALYEKGEVYINTIDFIRNCDENDERSDVHDSIKTRKYFGDVKVKMCDYGLDVAIHGTEFEGANCLITQDTQSKGNIYCLSGLYSEHLMGDRNNLDFDTSSFGEALIVIHNPKEFIFRLTNALKQQGFENFQYGRVSYYPHEYSGEVGIFRKHERFSVQNELRFFILNQLNAPIKLSIGSLRDIASIENNTLFQLTYTDGKVQTIKIGK